MTIQDFFRVLLGIQIKLEWFWVLRINLGICTLNGKDLSTTVDSKTWYANHTTPLEGKSCQGYILVKLITEVKKQ